MKKIFEDFKQFAFKGNVVDLAVGVMIGAAFGAIVTSLVNDLFMPLLSLLTGRIDFSKLSIALGEGEHASVIKYGAFLQSVVNFALIAICVFFFVKLVNKLHLEQTPAPASTCPHCKQETAEGATRCPHCTSQL